VFETAFSILSFTSPFFIYKHSGALTLKTDNVIALIFPKEAPTDKVALFYYYIFKVFNIGIFKKIKILLSKLLINLAPNLPESIELHRKKNEELRLFLVSYILLVLTLFVVHVCWTIAEGTFHGTNPNIYYFTQDIPNIFNYLFIVPLYVSFSCLLISRSFSSFQKMNDGVPKTVQSQLLVQYPQASLFLVAAICVFLSTLLTIRYMNELIDPQIYAKQYWFITHTLADGQRLLSSISMYYMIMPFVLFFFGIFTIFVYFSMMLMTISIGSKIPQIDRFTDMGDIRHFFKDFLRINLYAEIIVAAFMLNAFSWDRQQPANSFLFIAFIFALWCFGAFIISIPRYYIEIEWHKYQYSRFIKNQEREDKDEPVYEELRTKIDSRISLFLELAVFGYFSTLAYRVIF
jgi:hypothetical protein